MWVMMSKFNELILLFKQKQKYNLTFLSKIVYNINMKKIIQFSILKGDKYYTAEGVGLPVFTQGLTLDELVVNIKEATDLYFKRDII